MSAGGFQLKEKCHFRETDFLLCPYPRRISMGEGNILLVASCQLGGFFHQLFPPSIKIYFWLYKKSSAVGKSLSLTVVNSYACASQARVVPSTSYTPNRHKRSYEEDEEMDAQTQQREVSGKKTNYIYLLSFLFCFLPRVDFYSKLSPKVMLFLLLFCFFFLPVFCGWSDGQIENLLTLCFFSQ